MCLLLPALSNPFALLPSSHFVFCSQEGFLNPALHYPRSAVPSSFPPCTRTVSLWGAPQRVQAAKESAKGGGGSTEGKGARG